jgi:hypothetical protein
MWIFTEFGFFSIVSHRSKPMISLVRGRVRSDLLAFAARAGVDPCCVFEDAGADYRYRLELPKTKVQRVLSSTVEAMNYDNFKARVEELQGIRREQVYMAIWSHLNRSLM